MNERTPEFIHAPLHHLRASIREDAAFDRTRTNGGKLFKWAMPRPRAPLEAIIALDRLYKVERDKLEAQYPDQLIVSEWHEDGWHPGPGIGSYRLYFIETAKIKGRA
jgi:hypothetical protein